MTRISILNFILQFSPLYESIPTYELIVFSDGSIEVSPQNVCSSNSNKILLESVILSLDKQYLDEDIIKGVLTSSISSVASKYKVDKATASDKIERQQSLNHKNYLCIF